MTATLTQNIGYPWDVDLFGWPGSGVLGPFNLILYDTTWNDGCKNCSLVTTSFYFDTTKTDQGVQTTVAQLFTSSSLSSPTLASTITNSTTSPQNSTDYALPTTNTFAAAATATTANAAATTTAAQTESDLIGSAVDKILPGVLVPVILALFILVGALSYRQYHRKQRKDPNWTFRSSFRRHGKGETSSEPEMGGVRKDGGYEPVEQLSPGADMELASPQTVGEMLVEEPRHELGPARAWELEGYVRGRPSEPLELDSESRFGRLQDMITRPGQRDQSGVTRSIPRKEVSKTVIPGELQQSPTDSTGPLSSSGLSQEGSNQVTADTPSSPASQVVSPVSPEIQTKKSMGAYWSRALWG